MLFPLVVLFFFISIDRNCSSQSNFFRGFQKFRMLIKFSNCNISIQYHTSSVFYCISSFSDLLIFWKTSVAIEQFRTVAVVMPSSTSSVCYWPYLEQLFTLCFFFIFILYINWLYNSHPIFYYFGVSWTLFNIHLFYLWIHCYYYSIN